MVAPHPPRHRVMTTLKMAAASALLGLTAAGCMTGPRPSFDDDQPSVAPTGDAAIDAVLDRLDSVSVEQFTAGYSILTRLGGLESSATVVQADNSRRSITVNDIRFLDGTGPVATCNLTADECEATINDARISDLQIGHDFYAANIARRLRVDAGRKIGNARAHDETFAGQAAVCADVPVSGGTKIYCALDTGPLAKYDGNDVLIELTTFSADPDESAFATS